MPDLRLRPDDPELQQVIGLLAHTPAEEGGLLISLLNMQQCAETGDGEGVLIITCLPEGG